MNSQERRRMEQLEEENDALRQERAQLLRRQEELERQLLLDPLTDLGNRLAFDQALAAAAMRSHQYQFPICLVMVDIAEFDQFNNEHGHDSGDEVLKAVARLLKECSRQHDLAHRFDNSAAVRQGGDEFALILEACDGTGVEVVVERIRSALTVLEVPLKDSTMATVRLYVGAACGTGVNAAPSLIYRRASEALGVAKRQGKASGEMLAAVTC